ncbi:CRISPR-associated protein Csx18 [Geminocystis herdmanii]|uniref:CRISPR-associated protein Csx18 n=1 Tax=Geminocystis herdmanii TaxID=669359 RepID=UPI000345D847|nr:CRISPR-associated protein Csx18 [Geminocystis herdmanii]
MNFALVRTIVRFRSVLISIVNAGITWIILIIAPLGLFTVIVCTVAVFLSTLTLGLVGDFFLLRMLRQGRFNGVNGGEEELPFADSELPSVRYSESIRRRNNY